MNGDVECLNDILTNVVLESALDVGGKVPKESKRKLTTTTKDLIRKCCRMVMKTRWDTIEVVELFKTIN